MAGFFGNQCVASGDLESIREGVGAVFDTVVRVVNTNPTQENQKARDLLQAIADQLTPESLMAESTEKTGLTP